MLQILLPPVPVSALTLHLLCLRGATIKAVLRQIPSDIAWLEAYWRWQSEVKAYRALRYGR